MSTLSAQLVQLTLFGGTAARRSYPPSYKRARPQNASEERLAAIVRGVLIQRLEDRQEFVRAAVFRAMAAVGPTPDPAVYAQRLANEVVAEVCESLFPEEFAEPGDMRLPDTSLMPDRPLPRVGERHMEAFVKRLKGG